MFFFILRKKNWIAFGQQSKGENDSLASVVVLVFVLAKV